MLLLPLWLVFWVGRAIHARWGMTGLWIYVGALIMAAALRPVIASAPPPPPPTYPFVVITETSNVNPNP